MAVAAGLLQGADASSHREAPLITEDPVADLTDLYAFRSPDRPDTVTFVVNAIPFQEPGGGPNFYRFGDDVIYAINIDTDGDSLQDVSYDFRFTTTVRNPNTFLYNTGPVSNVYDGDLNVRQTYTVHEVRDGRSRVIGLNLPVPPVNIGPRSTPNYEAIVGNRVIADLEGGIRTFAGQRDDPFFADLGAIFDLGGLRPFNPAHAAPLPAEAGKDYLAGYNVNSIVVQVPINRLVEAGDPVLGVWASAYRPPTRVLQSGGRVQWSGNWIQVSRLGMPLVNEVVVPRGTKDRFNESHPWNDAQYLPAVINPELARLIPALYPSVQVPTAVSTGLGTGGREDVATIFLTGLPGVNRPRNVKPAEMLRINTSVPTAFPNGRTLTDDVVDASIRVLAGATAFSPQFNVAPNNQLGDGVNANDRPFLPTFPYVATPHSGYES